MPRRLALLLLALALPAGIWFFGRTSVHSQSPPSPETAADIVSVRLQFGVTDAEPRDWSGNVSLSGGALVKVRNWRPRPGDEVQGAQWKLATRKGIHFTLRPWEKQRLAAPEAYMLIPGVIVDVKGASARLRVTTQNGSFDVDVSSLDPGQPRPYLNGAVVADRVPSVSAISDPATDSEYQALLPGPDGEMWAAWVAYRNNGNSVQARRFNGTSWEAVQTVSGDHNDIFLVQAARDNNGGAWFIWSAQVSGNFDLYARRWDGKAWSAIERLTQAPQPDIYHAAATDSNGNAWVVWQGFRDGKSDIFARRHDGSRWLPEERVSASPANDWNPAIAADGQGGVYVAWDTYDKGNYDIQMRSWSGGRWSELIDVASTPLFEAYVSLACDQQNRVWAAWNEAGFEWGKDTGFLLKLEGSPLYEWRKLAVAVYSNGRWEVPADVESSLPKHLRGYNDIPKLHLDPAGRMWLAFRHRLLRIQDTPPITPAHRAAWEIHAVAYEGERWSEPVHFPFSNSRQDVRAAFANDSRGGVWAAFPTDHRDYEEFLYERAEAQVARVPVPSSAPAAPKLAARVVPELRAIVLHEDERGDLERIRGYVMASAGRRFKIYRGDTHRHTEFSMDGNNDGSLLDAYRYAIDAAELDYLMVSEHNSNAGPDREYINWTLQQMADVFTLPGKFLPLYGYERSVGYPNGHRNVIFARRGNPTLPIPVEEQKAKTGAKALYEYLKRYDGIAISHTSATNMGTDWRDNDPDVEPLVEIFQGDRISSEYEGAPLAAYSGNPASAPGGFRPAGYVWNAWAKGYKLGVQASSDHLSTHYSYACTISETFSKQALLQAMKARRSYGATDNIVLDYRLAAGSAEHMQGEIVEHKGPVRLKVKVTGTRPVRQIDVIRNNQIIRSSHDMAREVSFEFTDTQPLAGESYYYVRVQQVDNQMAWSSPIWIRR